MLFVSGESFQQGCLIKIS